MAIREIVKDGADILTKVCRKVDVFDRKLHQLLDDMHETMVENNGVGLAAPQVGILKRVCIIDTGDDLIELVNPEIIESSGTQEGGEGCLSFPGKFGVTIRPQFVKVKAFDRNGKEIVISGEDLKAKAFCHEIDHLNGIVFLTKVIEMIEQ